MAGLFDGSETNRRDLPPKISSIFFAESLPVRHMADEQPGARRRFVNQYQPVYLNGPLQWGYPERTT